MTSSGPSSANLNSAIGAFLPWAQLGTLAPFVGSIDNRIGLCVTSESLNPALPQVSCA
jgi:hypothetical protein